MKKAILPIIIGYSAIIMLSGCQSSNDESNISSVINSDLLNESSSFQSSVTSVPNSKDTETNSSSAESRKEENSSSISNTSGINQSDTSSESNSSQSSVTSSSNERIPENNSSAPNVNNSDTTSESNNSQTEVPNSTSSESSGTTSIPSSNNTSEPGTVEIIDGLLELKRDGQARGEIEPGMKIDYRKATLTKGSRVTFNVDCKLKVAIIKITLIDHKTGKLFEGSSTGKGVISFDIDADGEYVVTIENCYEKATYFTIEYHIGDEINSI